MSESEKCGGNERSPQVVDPRASGETYARLWLEVWIVALGEPTRSSTALAAHRETTALGTTAATTTTARSRTAASVGSRATAARAATTATTATTAGSRTAAGVGSRATTAGETTTASLTPAPATATALTATGEATLTAAWEATTSLAATTTTSLTTTTAPATLCGGTWTTSTRGTTLRTTTAIGGHREAHRLVDGDETVAVTVEGLEIFNRLARSAPLVQGNLSILVGVALTEPNGDALGQIRGAVNDRFLFAFFLERRATVGIACHLLLEAFLEVGLEFIQVNQTVPIGIPLLAFGLQRITHLIEIEFAIAVDISLTESRLGHRVRVEHRHAAPTTLLATEAALLTTEATLLTATATTLLATEAALLTTEAALLSAEAAALLTTEAAEATLLGATTTEATLLARTESTRLSRAGRSPHTTTRGARTPSETGTARSTTGLESLRHLLHAADELLLGNAAIGHSQVLNHHAEHALLLRGDVIQGDDILAVGHAVPHLLGVQREPTGTTAATSATSTGASRCLPAETARLLAELGQTNRRDCQQGQPDDQEQQLLVHGTLSVRRGRTAGPGFAYSNPSRPVLSRTLIWI